MRILPLACVLAACHPSPRPTPPPRPVPGVTGHVKLVDGTKVDATRGPLFITWMRPDERTALLTGQAPMMLLRDIVTRGIVVPDVDVKTDVTYTAHPPHGKVVLVAVIDTSHSGVLGLFGGAPILTGMSEAFDVTDATTTAPPISVIKRGGGDDGESCKGPRLTLEKIDAPETAGSIGNSPVRRACVRVPKDYADHPDRHYPVIYMLPGLFGTDSELAATPEVDGAIVIGFDTSDKAGSSYLADSPRTGAWDTFFATKLIPYIDAHYRTIPRREARALTGHSTGGYNAMSYGLRHPDLIGVIASSSPDGLDFEVWLDRNHIEPWILEFQRVEHALGGSGQFISYASDWSPTATGYDWPFDDNGKLVESVGLRWLANTPGAMLRDPKRVAAAKIFSGKVYITVGDTDEFGLYAPSTAFSKELTAAGIDNQLVITHGGHVTHVQEQLTAAMAFCTSKLEPAK